MKKLVLMAVALLCAAGLFGKITDPVAATAFDTVVLMEKKGMPDFSKALANLTNYQFTTILRPFLDSIKSNTRLSDLNPDQVKNAAKKLIAGWSKKLQSTRALSSPNLDALLKGIPAFKSPAVQNWYKTIKI